MNGMLLAGLVWAGAGEEAARQDRAHLTRLGAWAATSAVGGTVLMATGWKDPFRRNFGIQCVGWSLINAAIVGAAWTASGVPKTTEQIQTNREFLNLNLGLDVGYVGVGLSMAWGGHPDRPGLTGAGAAVALQGTALLVLDAWVLADYPKGR